jgi:hypothetical protein
LSWVFHDACAQTLLRAQRVALNPTFASSLDVGGADADLIADGCLVDIKATIRPRVTPAWVYQLLVYALLDYDDEHGIEEVGLYLARQRLLLRWPLADLIREAGGARGVTVATLRARFRRTLRTE